jgi:hypothetical protein
VTQVLKRRGIRGLLVVAMVLVLGIAAFLVFQPGAGVASGALFNTHRWLFRHGVPRWLLRTHALEFLFNVALFLPLGAGGALLWRRPTTAMWALIAFLLSASIELVQVVMPGRDASARDVVANTVGATLGAALMRWLLRRSQTEAHPAAKRGVGPGVS